MKILAHFTLLVIVFAGSATVCFAQDGNRTYEPPAQPAMPVEYFPSKWQSFSPFPEFNITMPGKPTASTREMNTPFGQLTLHDYLLTTETANYLISYFDIPKPLTDKDSIKAGFDAARDNMLARNKRMKLLKQQEVKVNGNAGRELLVEDGDMLVRHRQFVVGQRFYQIILAVPRKVAFKRDTFSSDAADFTDFYQSIVSRFLDSVSLFKGYGGGSAFKLDEALKKAVRGGVLNGKAISLPKPSYPGEARAAGVSGTVTVQVLIGEDGTVLWAKAVSGHPLLQEAARKAAFKARFAPLKSEGRPAKVTGVLTYNFAP